MLTESCRALLVSSIRSCAVHCSDFYDARDTCGVQSISCPNITGSAERASRILEKMKTTALSLSSVYKFIHHLNVRDL